MANYSALYGEIFDYLSADNAPSQETGLVVFGRKDLLVARKAIDIVRTNGASWMIISGGVGKDSGDLKVPEAEYLADEVYREHITSGLTIPQTYLDVEATNGAENARNSLAIAHNKHLDLTPGLTTIAHATSSRRLAEMMKHTALKQETPLQVYRQASDYSFDPSNPADQVEARAEMMRLVNWPAKGWLPPQEDIPENLIDFVHDEESKSK